MRKIAILLVFAALASWAASEDNCKIKVKKTLNGFDISVDPNKAYLRKGTYNDPQIYIFVPCSDSIVEFVTNNIDTIVLGGIKQDGVKCFYQFIEDTTRIPDNDPKHSLRQDPKRPRRNFLELSDWNIEKKLYVFGKDESSKTHFQILPCCGWDEKGLGQRLSVNFVVNSESKDRTFKKENDSIWITEPIEINNGDSIKKLRLERKFNEQVRFMVVNKILFDEKPQALSFHTENGSVYHQDDILYEGYFAIKLAKEDLIGGGHNLKFDCTVLTSEGPKNVTLVVPINVKETSLKNLEKARKKAKNKK